MRIMIGVHKKCGHSVITNEEGLVCILCGKVEPIEANLLNSSFDLDKPDVDS